MSTHPPGDLIALAGTDPHTYAPNENTPASNEARAADPLRPQRLASLVSPSQSDALSADAAPTTLPSEAAFERNSKWAKPGNYVTDLGPQEAEFQRWVKDNNIPFDPSDPKSDYDMRGYWKAANDPAQWQALQASGRIPPGLESGTTLNPNDGQPHYPDLWKTPYHQSFSNESQWATQDAPKWNDRDQLVDKQGNVVYDERAQ